MRNVRTIPIALAVLILLGAVSKLEAAPNSEKVGPPIEPGKVTLISKTVDLDHDGINEHLKIVRDEAPEGPIGVYLLTYIYNKPNNVWKKVGVFRLVDYFNVMKQIMKSMVSLNIAKDLTHDGVDEIFTTTASEGKSDLLKINVWKYDKSNANRPFSQLWEKEVFHGSIDIKDRGFTITEVNLDPNLPVAENPVKTSMYIWDGKGFSPEGEEGLTDHPHIFSTD